MLCAGTINFEMAQFLVFFSNLKIFEKLLNMVAEVISGKQIRVARARLSMTQPNFARWLSLKTGETIESIKVCRMENFKEEDSCHPLRPSVAVVSTIRPLLRLESVRTVALSVAKIKSGNSDNGSAHDGPTSANVDTESKGASGMQKDRAENRRKLLTEFAHLYDDLGILDAPGKSVTELIEAVEGEIVTMAEKLVGGTTDEREDIKERLKAIEEETKKIDAELEEVNSEFLEYDYVPPVNYSGMSDSA